MASNNIFPFSQDDDLSETSKEGAILSIDFAKEKFNPIERFNEDPKPYFEDKHFYKVILQNGKEVGNSLHKVFSDLINAKDAEVRGQARIRFIPLWWQFLENLVKNIGSNQPQPCQLAIRYGVLLPALISTEQQQVVASIIYENVLDEPIHYIDEWLQQVGSGKVSPLAMDEAAQSSKNKKDSSVLLQKREKNQGQFQSQLNLISIKQQEMVQLEESLTDFAKQIQDHDKNLDFLPMKAVYNSNQKAAFSAMQDTLRRLSVMDKELIMNFRELEKIKHELDLLEQKIGESGGDASHVVDAALMVKELGSLRQMCKMSCGRQGNHFPILMKQYMPPRLEDIATRENVMDVMAKMEQIDPGLFVRFYKGVQNRIVPHVILLPCYGDFGLCWEPFEKYNRSTSRGRLAVPMYTKNVKNAVIYALGDLRWQVAKERAGYRWMEEGLTGWYYQWFSEQGIRGDIREYFIRDYTIWLLKESEGTQKLDREVRGIFWRNIPFPAELRETLKNRGFVYSELYKKDTNRAMSDGY